jgi:hypothetical protein
MQFLAAPVEGLEISDRTGSKLRIVDFPNNGHVESMLALFDPDTGVFMGADHYIEAVFWNPTFERAANWVRRESSAATILGTHHRPLQRAVFLEAVKKRQSEWKPGRTFGALGD